MLITKSRDQFTRNRASNDLDKKIKIKKFETRKINSGKDRNIYLPNIPKTKRRKWVQRKKAISKFLDEFDYNNQIQSSYDLTLLSIQENIDYKDIA